MEEEKRMKKKLEDEATRAVEEAIERKKQAKLAKMPKVFDLTGLRPFEVDDISVDEEQPPPKKLMIKPQNQNLENFR